MTGAQAGPIRAGAVVWRDLVSRDPQALMRFYSEVFGWQFQATPERRYTLVINQGRPIAGLVNMQGDDEGASEASWVSFLSVPDVDKAYARVQAAGGKGYFPPTTFSPRGRLAVAGDPQGTTVGLLRAEGGDPVRAAPGEMDWLWTELWSHDPAASAAFYEGLLGFSVDTRHLAGRENYRVFLAGGEGVAGLMQLQDASVSAYWLPYVRVADATEIARRAAAAGGKVLYRSADGLLALIADPQGGVLAAQVWSPQETGE